MKNLFLIVLFLIFFFALGVTLEQSDNFGTTKAQLQKITLPSQPLALGKRGILLDKMGLQYVFPKDYSKFYNPENGQFNFKQIISLDSSRPEYRKNWTGHQRIPAKDYPSSRILDQDIIEKGIPILSVAIDEEDINHPETGIIENRKKKGRAWERPCFISYYDKGKLLFAGGAGIRIHGGSKNKRESESLRFYFRKIYGYDQFPPGIIFDDQSVPIKQIIARIEFNYASLLALDISKQIGCLGPEGHAVSVYVNGKRYGKRYALTEHLDEDWLRSHYGHDDFILLRTTGHPEDRRRSVPYQRLRQWVNDPKITMTMHEAGKQVDIENLSLWFISQFFTAGYDMYQGPLLLDRTRSEANWFWVNWDMDQCFRNTNEPHKKNTWEQEVNFHNVMTNPKRDRKSPTTGRYQNKDPRAILFRRMSKEDPDYKRYFERLFMNVMNHKLNSGFLDAWVDGHQRAITPLDTDDQAFFHQLRQFIQHRPAYLRKLMQKYYESPASYSCRISGLSEKKYDIDGYPTDTPYEGWYFKDTQVSITVHPESGERLAYWLVNGKPVLNNTSRFVHRVNQSTTIEPVFTRKTK